MARDFNQNRIANAVLKDKRVNSVGNFYAFQDNADGYNVLNVESLPSVKLMTGTNKDITEFAFFNDQNNYGGIGAYSLSALPKLKTIYIYQNSGSEETLDIDLHAFETNTELEKIYVHPDMKAKYMTAYGSQIAYGTTTIGDLLYEYSLVDEFVIPTMLSGETAPTTLTNEWLVRAINEVLGDNQVWKNVITKIVVPSYFTSVGVGVFNLSNLNMNYVTELKCNGTKTFASGWLNGGSWIKHLWLDNGSSTLASPYCTDDTVIYANFRVVAPYLVFANYFMQEHNIKTGVVCPIVGYNQFSSGASLPQESPAGEYLWFSNIDFDADYNSPTGLENDDSYVSSYVASSSGYYYCYDKTEILVIQDDENHVLTSALVEASINGLDTPKEWIAKVIVPADFTAYDNNSLNGLDNLANIDTLELGISNGINLRDVWANVNDKQSLQSVIYSPLASARSWTASYIYPFGKKPLTNCHLYTISRLGSDKSNFANVEATNVIVDGLNNGGQAWIFRDMKATNLYLPKCTHSGNNPYFNNSAVVTKVFIDNYAISNKEFYGGNIPNVYISPTTLSYFSTYYSFSLTKTICIVDGEDVYTTKGFSYPKFNGIDTEANIQLLTPADNALYLASDTGNLWQYTNGVWVNLFSGYTPTWYSDEDVATTISPSSITSDMTVYVKLTAI